MAIEAPFQIMLTVTLMSMGVLRLPGTENETLRNAYGFEIDFQWWPVFSSIISVIGILLGTLWMFQPIVNETNRMVGYLTFLPIFAFRSHVFNLQFIRALLFYAHFFHFLFIFQLKQSSLMICIVNYEQINNLDLGHYFT